MLSPWEWCSAGREVVRGTNDIASMRETDVLFEFVLIGFARNSSIRTEPVILIKLKNTGMYGNIIEVNMM